ncbi:iron-containing redox enzyme family protein [Micromonospora arborensis]|uniref:iron-containing redox enzyme family protein n=1 Tax=Micromonospora arborensis TaxID=2116518 RepID=UPI0033E94E99
MTGHTAAESQVVSDYGVRPGSTLRAAYQRACDPECFLPDGQLTDALNVEFDRFRETFDQSMRIDGRCRRAASWSLQQAERYLALVDAADAEAGSALVRRSTLACAPLGIVQGNWLQWLSSPGGAEDPIRLRLLALYASDLGVGRPRASRGTAYLSMLRTLGHAEHAAPVAALALDERIADTGFHLPAVLLTAGRRPDDFVAEIVGADLCLRAVGLLPALSVVQKLVTQAADWNSLNASTARGQDTPTALNQSLAAAEALAADGPELALGVARGFHWAFEVLRVWNEATHAELAAALNPAFEMAELLRFRAREAMIYHHDFRMGDRSLAHWLAEARTNPAPLMAKLATSRLIRPGDSAHSPLLTSLISERGPMFRIFSPGDLAVIRRWIDGTPISSSDTAPAPPGEPLAPPDLSTLDAGAIGATAGTGPADLREAYHLLLRRTGTVAVHRYAHAYVHGWLARAGHDMDANTCPLPDRWPASGLHEWLIDQHDRHAAGFDESEAGPLPSRDALVDSTVQLAPLTLIDGSWLQGFTDAELATSEVGFSLFDTYWDELGNGEPRLNHPLIYRQVLAEMAAEPPPTDSVEFTRWPRFRDASFELPVYWLSIGRFPRTFLPEVLGLNLAMELSGVGGSYRRARIALKAHGFDTRFVDIHNTIDNIATGHSAWAARAIDTFMSALPDTTDAGLRRATWDRVRAGYRSLDPPDSRAARRAQRRAMRRFSRD